MHTQNILSAIASLLFILPANAQAPPNQAPSPTKPTPNTTPKITPDPPKDQPEDPSFEQIFKRSRTTQGVQRIIVPWSIDTQTQGQILVVFSTDNISSLRVQSTTLLSNLAEVVRPEILEKLKAAIDAEKNLSLDVLRENGLKAIFDERRLGMKNK